MTQVYYTEFNNARPFKVTITNNVVSVAKLNTDDTESKDKYLNIFEYHPLKIFVGKSKIHDPPKYWGEGSSLDGNSILLHMTDNEYIYIGQSIYSFTSLSEIIQYESPVGGSYVPYPYAIDKENNFYLLAYEIIFLHKPYFNYDDPYTHYDDVVNILSTKFNNINKFKINHKSQKYLCISNDPEQLYNELSNNDTNKLTIYYKDKSKMYIKKHEYMELMDEYKKYIGYTKLVYNMIYEFVY